MTLAEDKKTLLKAKSAHSMYLNIDCIFIVPCTVRKQRILARVREF